MLGKVSACANPVSLKTCSKMLCLAALPLPVPPCLLLLEQQLVQAPLVVNEASHTLNFNDGITLQKKHAFPGFCSPFVLLWPDNVGIHTYVRAKRLEMAI